VAAGGFLTKRDGKPVPPDPRTITINGQSCLPMIGGVSHSVVEHPHLAYPDHIHYGRCETYAWGRLEGDVAKTTMRSVVHNVRLTTGPWPPEEAPGVDSVTFEAERIAIEVDSMYPENGDPSFEYKVLETLNMALTASSKENGDQRTPIQLVYDEALLKCPTMAAIEKAFLTDEEFFKRRARRYPDLKLVFGKSKLPRTKQGYYLDSIVKQIVFGEEIIEGNTFTKPGFGTLSFGLLQTGDLLRRVSMGQMKMGSDPGGDVDLGGAETNGIWK